MPNPEIIFQPAIVFITKVGVVILIIFILYLIINYYLKNREN